jgi:NADH-quinone oxidoreductase subunit M
MGGLWTVAPRLSGAALFFSLASLGLPGMGDFIGELLVLLGSYKISISITVVASLGILASTFYALRMVQRAFQGPNTNGWQIPDLVPREKLMMAGMMLGLLLLGLYPQPVFNASAAALDNLQRAAQSSAMAFGR